MSQPQSDLGENATHEELWEHYCNKPTILSWHEAMPEGVNRILEKDWRKKGTRSYRKDFVRLYENDYKETRKPGEFYKEPIRGGKQGYKGKRLGTRSNMAPHLSTEEGLTVEYKSVEKSAKMLCDSKTAMGPDYVNVPEGLFCRMSDKTLFPLCEFNDTGGLHENCFNVESQELVLRGGKLLKRSQYAFVRHRGPDYEKSDET
ncbi:hypothetical protein SLS53_007400 [Cytospora paraplurivora]|uniref:Uncharacterized protein n=1 Tax=Cytospora paraplurivora TaxID=2898453 RepID=A0AAN9U865_9PEZI